MNKVQWLLVGAGDISRKRVGPALAQCQNSEIVAVCDTMTEQAKSLATTLGQPKVFGDFDEAVAKSQADAVYLAVPVWLHVPLAIKALKAGKHVIVEKPLGLNGAECVKLSQAAERSGKLATCAYFRRFYPRYQYAKEMLGRGEFGQVVLVRMVYFSWADFEPDDPKYWRVVKAKSGGGPLSDMGSHMFDVLIGLFGMPVSVFAKCDNLVHKWDVEDSASIIMKLRNGAHVTATINWNSKTWRHEFEIVGTEAKLNWLPYDTGAVVKTVGRQIEQLDQPNAENVHLPLIEDFVRAIQAGDRPYSSLAEAAKTNILLDAVYESGQKGTEIVLG